MAAASAHDVAAAIRRRLPGVGLVKLHKLLYFAQGFNLAHLGEPLFEEAIEAWDHGPVVAEFWKEDRFESDRRPLPLDNGQLNTIGYVISRYGANSGHELETITHNEGPWAEAYERKGGNDDRHVIHLDDLRSYFLEVVEADRDEDEVKLSPEVIARLLTGSAARVNERGTPDTLDSLRARMHV
jgi:uncharacterized phage-associated protein